MWKDLMPAGIIGLMAVGAVIAGSEAPARGGLFGSKPPEIVGLHVDMTIQDAVTEVERRGLDCEETWTQWLDGSRKLMCGGYFEGVTFEAEAATELTEIDTILIHCSVFGGCGLSGDTVVAALYDNGVLPRRLEPRSLGFWIRDDGYTVAIKTLLSSIELGYQEPVDFD